MVAWEFSGKTSGDRPGLFMSLIMRPRELRGGPLSGPHTRGPGVLHGTPETCPAIVLIGARARLTGCRTSHNIA